VTPGLLLPGALAALTALAIPLIIHIARSSDQRQLDFAALRWLRQKPRPRSRVRLDEWPLLLSRLLLLALVAVWLARPALLGAGDKTPYVAVIPGADIAQASRAAEQGARVHWLAPGFPDLKQTRPTLGADATVASLIRQLDADLPRGAPLSIVTPTVIEGADGERLRLSRSVDWRVVPGAMPARAATPAAIPPLSIRYDAGHASGVRYLRAAALAWQPAGREADLEIAGLDAALPAASRKLVWLGSGALPTALVRWIEAGGAALVAVDTTVPTGAATVVWRDDLDRPLVEARPMGAGRLMRFTRKLAPAETPELLSADFPDHLRALFAPTATAPARGAAADYAPLTGGRRYEQQPQDLRPWLAVLIGLTLLAERWLATRRSRSVTP